MWWARCAVRAGAILRFSGAARVLYSIVCNTADNATMASTATPTAAAAHAHPDHAAAASNTDMSEPEPSIGTVRFGTLPTKGRSGRNAANNQVKWKESDGINHRRVRQNEVEVRADAHSTLENVFLMGHGNRYPEEFRNQTCDAFAELLRHDGLAGTILLPQSRVSRAKEVVS